MPYDVTTEDALQYEEVRKRLARSISKLKQVTTMFLATIVKARHRLPYGLLYIAQVLRNALRRKFSACAEKDILKIVGNLLYYRFLNSAIVAPDAFVDMKKNTNINDEKKTRVRFGKNYIIFIVLMLKNEAYLVQKPYMEVLSTKVALS